MDKSQIINEIIETVQAESYVEVGYGNGHNFDQIKCMRKLSCDVNPGSDFTGTSDEFFEAHKDNFFNVVFIDGLHHADQVRKDIINSMKSGAIAIILHDTLPSSEAMQKVPREQKEWTGDVWRAVVGFKESYPDIRMETYRSDYGLSCIYPEGKKVRKHFENMEMSYGEFKKNEVELLNIVD